MTNWKADPKVKALLAKLDAGAVMPRFKHLLPALCEAVAASGSPPSPADGWGVLDAKGHVSCLTQLRSFAERDAKTCDENWPEDRPHIVVDLVRRASSGSTGRPSHSTDAHKEVSEPEMYLQKRERTLPNASTASASTGAAHLTNADSLGSGSTGGAPTRDELATIIKPLISPASDPRSADRLADAILARWPAASRVPSESPADA